jgi:hypothetical protein
MMLDLDFIPPDQISNMSLNGLRRRVATRVKTTTEPQMDESLVASNIGHRVSSSGLPPPSFGFSENRLLEDLRN